MSESPELTTERFKRLLKQTREGNLFAREELVRASADRLERLARSMLRRFPNVGIHDQTGDIVQGATMRLLRSLNKVDPPSLRDFYNLAALEIRRELLDLARHYRHQNAHARPLDAHPLERSSHDAGYDPPSDDDSVAGLDRWTAFHEQIERLPPELREVMSLTFYHGWTQQQIAELLQVSDRTIRRYWRDARRQLTEKLGGELPDAG